MEGLEYLLDYDAARSLHWPRRAIVASAPEGLTTEYLAADKAIAMLEKILGDHRASLAVGTELRSGFIATPEAYLQQGWPRALIVHQRVLSRRGAARIHKVRSLSMRFVTNRSSSRSALEACRSAVLTFHKKLR
jgi:hypothetical protein